jgi:hypothetical protein
METKGADGMIAKGTSVTGTYGSRSRQNGTVIEPAQLFRSVEEGMPLVRWSDGTTERAYESTLIEGHYGTTAGPR